MSISSELYKVNVVGDGSTPSIAFNRKVFASADVKGFKYDTTTNIETALVNGVDFTVSGAGDTSTGVTVTPAAAIPSGTNWVIYTDAGATQGESINPGAGFPGKATEYALDKVTIATQEADGKADRALKLPISDTASTDLPNKTDRASKVLGFDASGNPTAYAQGTSTNSDAVNYDLGGTGSIARTVENRLQERVSVVDFGATGDDTTDDRAAIQAAIDYLVARVNSVGYSGGELYFPYGSYKIVGALNIAAADAGIVNGISFTGDGGYAGEGGTIIKFQPSSGSDGLVLKSTQGCVFRNIEFISANNNVGRMLYVTSQPSPTFSAFHNTFENCSFRNFTSTTPSDKLISIAGGVLTSFKRCWFSGTDQKIGLGEFALAATTESGGGAGQTLFEQCEIYTDIEVQNAQSTTFINSVFGRKNIGDLVSIYPVSSNFTRNDFCTFIGCSQVLNIDGDDQTFFTQGASSDGVIALNNRFEGYKTVWNFTGTGNAFLSGNEYTRPTTTANCIAVILGANAERINLEGENFEDFVDNGHIAVDDNRSGVRLPLVVDSELGADHTFAGVGAFEDIITANLRLRGGMYRVRYAASLDSNATAVYTFRVTVDGAAINKLSSFKTVASGDQQMFYGEALVAIDGTTSAIDIKLTGQQATGTVSIVKQNGTSYTTFLQVEEA